MPAITRVGANQAGGVITGPGAPTVKAEGARVSLKGDKVAAHGKPPHAAPVMVGSSSTVFANGTGIVRVGDAVTSHTFPGCATHAPPLSAGSSNVFVEGKAMGRKDDTYGCGAQITSGSSNVFANGN